MKRSGILVGCLFVLCACPTPFNSGISGDTAINSITGEDETALCNAMETEAEAQGVTEAQKQFGCFLAGQLTAAFAMDGSSFEETCQESYDSCMAEEPEATDEATCELNFGDCAAPLADYEACTVAGWDELKSSVSELNCKEGEEEEGSDDEVACTAPEACKALYDACPSMDPCSAAE